MADEDRWTRVDEFVIDRLIGPDPALESTVTQSARAGLPAIAVSAPQGKLLQLLARMVGARRILEIGTLGGYSTIWLARSLPPDGSLVTLELDPRHAEVARANLERAGLADRVEVRVGPALEALPRLREETAAAQGPGGHRPFDLVFIDADKDNIPAYFDHSVALTRPGGVIVVDNVVRGGALADSTTGDGRVLGVQRFHEELKDRADVSATTIQTVGSKGYDGFTLAMVEG